MRSPGLEEPRGAARQEGALAELVRGPAVWEGQKLLPVGSAVH